MSNEKNISIDNYQAYLLDYFEGNLQESETDMLFAFLAAHPALQAEFDAYENITATPAKDIHFPHKETLLRERITFENYKTWFIAAHEGDLTEAQQTDLHEFLAEHPWLQAEFQKVELYKATAPAAIRFPDHDLLLRTNKQPGKIITLWRPMAVAASIALLFVVGYMLRNPVAPPAHFATIDSTQVATPPPSSATQPSAQTHSLPAPAVEKAGTAVITEQTAAPQYATEKVHTSINSHIAVDARTTHAQEKIQTVPQKSSSLAVDTHKELPTLLVQETLPLPQNTEDTNVPTANVPEPTTLNKIVDLAAAGLKEVNKRSGTEIVTLDQKADKDSHTLAFSIGPFEFSRKVQR